MSTIKTDSRIIERGDTYVALRGEKFDGHDYVEMARQNGASKIIMDNETFSGEDIILVDDTFNWYRYAGYTHRMKFDIPVIVIAGSNGKTTTKELLVACLGKKFNVCSTLKNENNGIGIPKTLLEINESHDIAVVEVGANQRGEHFDLVLCAHPTHIYMTNHGKDHMEGYGDEHGVRMSNNEVLTVGRYTNSVVFVQNFEPTIKIDAWGIEQVVFDNTATYDKNSVYGKIATKEGEINSQLFGAFNGKNMLAAYGIASYFGVSFAEIKSAIEEYEPSMMRSQTKKIHGKELILDCYNANPTSMKEMIMHAINHSNVPTSLILGGMREMGEFETREHKSVIEFLMSNRQSFDSVILIGREWVYAGYDKTFIYYDSVDMLKELCDVWKTCEQSSRIIVKGSRGVALEKLFI